MRHYHSIKISVNNIYDTSIKVWKENRKIEITFPLNNNALLYFRNIYSDWKYFVGQYFFASVILAIFLRLQYLITLLYKAIIYRITYDVFGRYNSNSVVYFIACSILNDEVILKIRINLCVITQAAAKYKIALGRTKRRYQRRN